MSHFTVLVIGDNVEGQLAPYDENREVAPYRDYLADQDPNNYWFVDYARKNGADVPADLTWEWVANYGREAFPEDFADPDSGLQFDQDGKVYQWSTYNPDSKWDWYQIGGRWRGYFDLKPSTAGALGEPGVFERLNFDNDPPVDYTGKADSTIKGNIDIDGMRQRAADEAGAAWDKVHAVLSKYPNVRGWSHFFDRYKAGEFTIEQARAAYREQREPINAELGAALGVESFWDCPLDEYSGDRETFVQRAFLGRIPGYALLIRGKWFAKGEMGWFGMGTETSDSELDYLRQVNRFIDEASDDTLFTIVDCHV